MIIREEFALVLISLTLVLSINMVVASRMSKIPMRGGCFRLSSEVPELHLQGEAVVLRCVFLERYLSRQGFSQNEGAMSFLRVVDTGSGESIPIEERVRVKEQRRRLWFLPAQARDSGTYSCEYRNASYCCASTIALQVYDARQPHLDMISYPMSAPHGQNMKLSCHHIKEFNISGNLTWYKDATPIASSMNRTRYRRETNTSLTVQNVGWTDEGFYTCQLQILFNSTEYTVTRVIKLSVTAPEPRHTLPSATATPSHSSVGLETVRPKIVDPVNGTFFHSTLAPEPRHTLPSATATPSHSSVGLETVRPKIIDPVNGTFFHSTLGSSLLIMCKASSGNQSADTTEVTWLINGHTVQESFLSSRVLMGEKKVTVENGVNYIELGLIFLELFEEDTRAEIKCVAQNHGGREEVVVQVRLEDSTFMWFIVAAAGTVCFLMMACVILYQLLNTRRKTKYMLARQSSTF
ncbi:hypothetical protein SKAU_G00250580 [Synaphobranchus kaupii]|uniref:Ig-like domain-containing protein n=1 Tax=Synaphobranchus kaupii TaxID=118154 RepID=A0A9Q1IRK2_SYNKA|nr:hypothetical protein SKAU_G00250580 [Synaphobranchus kaupii]